MATKQFNAEARIFKGFGLASLSISPEVKLLMRLVRKGEEIAPRAPCIVCKGIRPIERMRTIPGGKMAGIMCRPCHRKSVCNLKTTNAAAYALSVNEIDHIHTVFKSSLSRVNKVSSGGDYKPVTLEYIASLWSRQKGRCAISGRVMTTKNGKHTASRELKLRGSLDRIDNAIGYVEGNLQWACWGANQMKHVMETSDLVAWCCDIARTAGGMTVAKKGLRRRSESVKNPSLL